MPQSTFVIDDDTGPRLDPALKFPTELMQTIFSHCADNDRPVSAIDRKSLEYYCARITLQLASEQEIEGADDERNSVEVSPEELAEHLGAGAG